MTTDYTILDKLVTEDVAASWIGKGDTPPAAEATEEANPCLMFEIIATSESGARAYNEDRFIIVEVKCFFLILFHSTL